MEDDDDEDYRFNLQEEEQAGYFDLAEVCPDWAFCIIDVVESWE